VEVHALPDTPKHHVLHDRPRHEVEALVQRAARGEPQLTPEVLNLLKKWWLSHIQGADKQLGPFLTDKVE
jgi:hemerythrin